MTGYISDLWTTYYDPWFGWILFGILVAVFVSWMAWLFDILRPLAGAIVVGIAAGLAGMRKGQHIERDRQAARERNEDRWRW
jgi:hypothetical protein